MWDSNSETESEEGTYEEKLYFKTEREVSE